MDSADTRQRSVAALGERQFEGLDHQPVLKAEARAKLLDQATRAADIGGRVLALSMMTVGGVPVPASMTHYMVDVH